MTTTPPVVNIDDWYDLAAIGFLTVGGWVTTLITVWWGQRRHNDSVTDVKKDVTAVKGDVGAIRTQVENSHQTNLRNDIDKLARLIESNTQTTELVSRQLGEVKQHVITHGKDIGGLRDEVGDVRGELRQERRNREKDNEELQRKIDGLAQQ